MMVTRSDAPGTANPDAAGLHSPPRCELLSGPFTHPPIVVRDTAPADAVPTFLRIHRGGILVSWGMICDVCL